MTFSILFEITFLIISRKSFNLNAFKQIQMCNVQHSHTHCTTQSLSKNYFSIIEGFLLIFWGNKEDKTKFTNYGYHWILIVMKTRLNVKWLIYAAVTPFYILLFSPSFTRVHWNLFKDRYPQKKLNQLNIILHFLTMIYTKTKSWFPILISLAHSVDEGLVHLSVSVS